MKQHKKSFKIKYEALLKKIAEMFCRKKGGISCLLIVVLICSGCAALSPSKLYGTANVSPLVEQWRTDVERYASEYGIAEYVELILAIIAQESGGDAERYPDIMQSSESAGKEPDDILDPQESLRQGISYLSTLFQNGRNAGVDTETVVQSYNFGGSYILYVRDNFQGVHSESVARTFSAEQAKKLGWSSYGDVLYVEHVYSHMYREAPATACFEKMYEVMLEYEGVPYLFGGDSKSGIDCSAMSRRLYQAVGITLPRTAQEQYNQVTRIDESQVQKGDLVFFQGTYASSRYITHVGVYVGDNRFFHAGGSACHFSELSGYYREHFVCFGRR